MNLIKDTNKIMHFVIISLILFIIIPFTVAQENYQISPPEIKEKIKVSDFLDKKVTITNTGVSPLSLKFSIDEDIIHYVKLNQDAMIVDPNTEEELIVSIFGENLTLFYGLLHITGDINQDIPIDVVITDAGLLPVEALLIDIEPITEAAKIGDVFNFKVNIQNLLSDERFNVTLHYSIDKLDEQNTYVFNKSFFEETENIELGTSITRVKEYDMPDFIRPGRYVINVKAGYLNLDASASRTFMVVEPFWDHVILGIIPVRWLILLGSLLLLLLIGFIMYQRRKAKKKRYIAKIDFDLLPKPGPRAVYLGMIAETTHKTYFDLDNLTTHTLIAGSTGGGKTVSAEILVEEALMKDVAVLVFDPTAQWSGFLRKNTDKKMFSFYSKFGLKKSEARAFNGNVRQVEDAREVIDIKKVMKPGEINIFTINKLDPEDADILVSNTIREVFHANLPEARELKLIIIFDEVHRLLPKFGGSGQGFIQIERGAREFRKWGVGLMLISQVLSDFVGETKANINTEIQMRTRDQGDLDRIKGKYGGYMLQSLLKSSTGTGMLENAAYNKGNPYFVSFRPLLHEHARLSDEELNNYNKYNEIIDELDYQIEQLDKEGIDVFDLRLELKMALDKVKQGSFNMVDIYLEGLKPRLKSQWKELGKSPEKKKKRLVSEDELKKEFLRAQEERKKFEEEEGEEAKVLKFANGIVVKNMSELLDAIKSMDDATFNHHFGDGKNDFASWLMGINKGIAEEVKTAQNKEEIIVILKNYVQ